MIKIFNYFKSHFLYLGYNRKEFKRILPKIDEFNLHSMKTFPVIASFIFGILTIFTFFVDYMWQYFPTYLFGLGVSVVSRISVRFAKKSRHILDFGIGFFIMALYIFGVLSGTLYGLNRTASSFSALLMAVPLLFCAKPIYILLGTLITDITFIQFTIIFKDKELAQNDILNIVAFSIVSIIISTVINKGRLKRFFLEEALDYARQTDEMTCLKNRNSFELKLNEITSSKLPMVTCIYVDVNGLHDLNNSQGHEAGDKMLKCIAQLFKENFGEKYTYRIGGDEYFAFDFENGEEAISLISKKFEDDVKRAGYHVAVGICCSTDKSRDILEVIKSAEVKMYEEKSAYYKSIGKEHR